MLDSDTTSNSLRSAKYRTGNISLFFRDAQADLQSDAREAIQGFSLHTEAHKLAHKGQ